MISILAQVTHYQTNNNVSPAVPLMVLLAIGCGVLVIELAILAVVCWLISDSLAKVPQEYRQNITPGQVWMLMIPLFNLVWSFFVFQRIPDSFRAYFEATGRPQPGDYGKTLGLSFSIVACCCIIAGIIPCVGLLVPLAAIVLLILLVVKFVGYKNLIVSGGGTGFPVNPPTQPPQI